MTALKSPETTAKPSLAIASSSDSSSSNALPQSITQKIKGGIFLAVGYLLSPLCWWNDLIINLPIAYGFGYVVSLWQADWFFPAAIAGYWLSNLVGIVLMQMGAKDVLQSTVKKRSLKKEIFSGVLTSTAYTVVIVALVYFHILDLSAILPIDEKFSLAFLNPQN
ncbi:hypothetical protein [Pseudanabaena sp. ABRG5-3]|uniref:hypothetical protein n=1 Tax=Pseudanabaena sp. ABRG5-3 TaxID=685565 RepID=UPI000DC712FC|nr:hypothetical protein [Pseudanabaena sp. ABRG5-3]BBC26885.1 hypothetical protein ABRG53_c046 [Pseudanabaena sp. ABRG5-3]